MSHHKSNTARSKASTQEPQCPLFHSLQSRPSKREFREGPANATTTHHPWRHPQTMAVDMCPFMWLGQRYLHAHLCLWARSGKETTLLITAPPVSISAVLRGDDSFSRRFYSLFSQSAHDWTLFAPFPPLTSYSSPFLTLLFLLPPLLLCQYIFHSHCAC